MRDTTRSQNLIERLIASAVMAGAYRILAKNTPGAERGLLKMADKHSGIAAELAGRIRDDRLGGA